MIHKISPIKLYFRNRKAVPEQRELTDIEKFGTKNSDELNKMAVMNKSIVNTTRIDKADDNYKNHNIENYTGCLIGGATGDALGWPVEFYRLDKIKETYGKNGISDMQLYGQNAQITDDTQMTIFTADGLLKSAQNEFNENKKPDMDIIYDSYLNWLKTQYCQFDENEKGWIANLKELYSRRAPGTTCTGSLRKGVQGSIENPTNQSKGCGGVMRVAPVGLMYYKNPELAFEVGAQCAALTHGSPDAYLPAGVHASIIANIIQGKNIEESIENSVQILKKYKGHENLLALINKAIEYSSSNIPQEEAIFNLGEGWHGDEAIAIAIYCILKSPNDFEKAVIMAVNHNGDSDSTGAIVGNILGAYLGEKAIPNRWKQSLELKNELKILAQDLLAKPNEIEKANLKYPTPKQVNSFI